MTRTVLAIRHVHFEDLGSLAPALLERGYAVRYLDAAIDDLDAVDAHAPDLLAVLGGPIGAFDEARYPFLQAELALVRRRLQSRRPLLGICLGAQLIARALGAKVYPMGVKEIGYAPLELTTQGKSSALAPLEGVPVLHWHGDQFDIPAGAAYLAATGTGAHQAFALGDAVLGLQFHLEAEAATLERWLVGHAGELAQCGIDPRTLRAQAAQSGKRLEAAAAEVLARWLARLTVGQ
ncbi:glutamine amidotransferase [Herbaspirillum sp. WKF16]|uniref:glutamine amidotransferase n=1 Tax=Herbaspirillum sp. WKF16 TaxID=3028312 RepID=UPI0023A9F3E7|nr:glutamine amidotransferase [Herbaspirillum sp. WKF16]WDZ94866.1 glutamine amidotransferase [Herbaspirillum sp. WKF16]